LRREQGEFRADTPVGTLVRLTVATNASFAMAEEFRLIRGLGGCCWRIPVACWSSNGPTRCPQRPIHVPEQPTHSPERPTRCWGGRVGQSGRRVGRSGGWVGRSHSATASSDVPNGLSATSTATRRQV